MNKDPKIFVLHILECIEIIEGYVCKIGKDEFLKTIQIQDSIIRRIEIIGEAVKHIPVDIKANHTNIVWDHIVGMRNILIHDYWGVDLDLTWKVATKELSNLKTVMLEIKKELDSYKD
jgi:uncharacterized protein with HEPN domain